MGFAYYYLVNDYTVERQGHLMNEKPGHRLRKVPASHQCVCDALNMFYGFMNASEDNRIEYLYPLMHLGCNSEQELIARSVNIYNLFVYYEREVLKYRDRRLYNVRKIDSECPNRYPVIHGRDELMYACQIMGSAGKQICVETYEQGNLPQMRIVFQRLYYAALFFLIDLFEPSEDPDHTKVAVNRCNNTECDTPFFIKQHGRQKYCPNCQKRKDFSAIRQYESRRRRKFQQ